MIRGLQTHPVLVFKLIIQLFFSNSNLPSFKNASIFKTYMQVPRIDKHSCFSAILINLSIKFTSFIKRIPRLVRPIWPTAHKAALFYNVGQLSLLMSSTN